MPNFTHAMRGGALALICSSAACAPSHVELLSVGRLAANARDDLSVLPTKLENGTPHNRLGGAGSAIAYTGVGTKFVAAPDRGPGARSSFVERFHVLDLEVGPAKTFEIRRLATTQLSDERGLALLGTASAFERGDPRRARRRDFEAIRVSARGTIYVADEYGPVVEEFDAKGRRLRSFKIPEKFLIDAPAASAGGELPPHNQHGRLPKLGMEGLAISPNGERLYALMQSPLVQDHAFASQEGPRGLSTRLLEIDVTTGNTRELVYALESANHGTNEILAINDHEFLVIERDWKADDADAFKRIFKIDVQDASDVSDIERLPAVGLPPGVRAVRKEPFVDLRSRAFGLSEARCPEKIEGLAFGPDLPDGRHLLLVSCDNDFSENVDTIVLAFAVAREALPSFAPQVLQPEGILIGESEQGAAHVASQLAVLSTPLFDAPRIVPGSLRVRCAGARVQTKVSGCSAQDVNADGLSDLRCQLAAPCSAPTADQLGLLFDGRVAAGWQVSSHATLPRDAATHHAAAH